MPKKKGGVNEKVEAAREREESKKQEEKVKAGKQAEDEFWQAAGEGNKSKAQAKKETQAKEREEAAAKKAEAKRLAEQEALEMASFGKKKAAKPSAPKVTQHELTKQKEADKKQQETERKAKEAAAKRMVTEGDYASLVEQENINQQEDRIEARNLDDAIKALDVGDTSSKDKHPERRLKASFAAYSDAELATLKKEKPGLKMSQYKDMIWKSWQKSPSNPMNQPQE